MICLFDLSFVSQKLGLGPRGQIIKSKFDFMISFWAGAVTREAGFEETTYNSHCNAIARVVWGP